MLRGSVCNCTMKSKVAEVGKALQTPDLRAGLADLGYEATGIPTDKFADIVKQDTDRWGAVIKSVGGITLD